MRKFAGFLIAPGSFAVLLIAVSIFTSSPQESTPFILIILAVSYSFSIIIGVPLFLLMSKMGWTGIISYSIAAILCTLILCFLFIILPIYQENDGDLSTVFMSARVMQLLIISVACFLTVLIFWLIARPDRLN